jgi:L-aspartate oxidase
VLIALISTIAGLQTTSNRVRFANIAAAARLIAVAALRREESRGGHWRADFPLPSDQFRQRSFLTLDDADRVVAELTGRENP